MRIKSILEIKNHKVNTNFLASTVLILVVILLISTSVMFFQVAKRSNSLNKEKSYSEYATNLIDSIDLSTYRLYNYVVTGDERYYIEYMNEIDVNKTKEKAVYELLQLELTAEEEQIVKEILSVSDKLNQIAKKAFDLAHAGKIEEAEELVFNSEYGIYKNQIYDNYLLLKESIGKHIEEERVSILSVTKITYSISILVGIGTAILTILLLMALYRIKLESDIDQLTGLQNRNRYKENIKAIIEKDPTRFGALIFCDIDNLKFVNDCYGHNSGDKYIQATAKLMKEFSEYTSMIARPSGDEFIAYIHGFDSEKEMKKAIEEKLDKMRNAFFVTTLHIEEKIRFSTGIAIYPTDTENVEELVKFADYAMFKMKKRSKGEVSYYDKTTIDKTLFLSRNSKCLDQFLENELVDFAMQPIVDANTFEVYGYEALMRPKLDILNSPYLLLELAKSESKLDKVERLVLKKMFEKINDNIELLKNYKIFINSIADQVLTEAEFNSYIESYPNVLENVVIEVTEQTFVEEEILKGKTEKFKDFGALVALDDYGAGYSNENSLLSGIYDLVKIDMNIIRNIDTDIKRQEIVKSLIKLSEINNYKVLAEGVETESEVKILREFGVHFMQGYFFGKPDLEIKGISQKAIDYLKLRN